MKGELALLAESMGLLFSFDVVSFKVSLFPWQKYTLEKSRRCSLREGKSVRRVTVFQLLSFTNGNLNEMLLPFSILYFEFIFINRELNLFNFALNKWPVWDHLSIVYWRKQYHHMTLKEIDWPFSFPAKTNNNIENCLSKNRFIDRTENSNLVMESESPCSSPTTEKIPNRSNSETNFCLQTIKKVELITLIIIIIL